MSQVVRLGPCSRVYSGEFIGPVTVPQFRWICRDCLVEGAESFVFGPPYSPSADPVLYAELKAEKASAPGTRSCPGDYGSPAGVHFEGKYTDDHL